MSNKTEKQALNFYDAKAMSEIMEKQRAHLKDAVAKLKEWRRQMTMATNDIEMQYMVMEQVVLEQTVSMHYKTYVATNRKFFEIFRIVLNAPIQPTFGRIAA